MDGKLKILTPAEKRAELESEIEGNAQGYAELIAEAMNTKEMDDSFSIRVILENVGKGLEKAIKDLKLEELGWKVNVINSFDGNSKRILHYVVTLSES